MGTALWVFLGLIVAVFIIVFVLQTTGFFRTRSYKGEASNTTPEPGINMSEKATEDRLEATDLHNRGLDPRGDDIGGNFSGVSNRGDTSGENRR